MRVLRAFTWVQVKRRAVTCRPGPILLRRHLQLPYGPQTPGPPDAGPLESDDKSSTGDAGGSHTNNGSNHGSHFDWQGTFFKMAEASLTTFASVAVLGAVGYGYTRYYKHMILEKMENAFRPGDPVLDLAATAKQGSATGGQILMNEDHQREHWVLREEQALIDDIVAGKVRGQYHLIIGEKGTGKSSMLIDALAKIDGEGCAMFDAHANPEIFRIRLGKALV
jgi:hypothetical protein